MKFSEIPEYISYMNYYSRGDFRNAVEALEEVIKTYKSVLSIDQISDIVRRIGIVKYKAGDELGAVAAYRDAEKQNPTSMLISYQFAKFLLDDLGQRSEGLRKCDKMIQKLNSSVFPETDDDFSSEQYTEMVINLKKKFSW